MKIIRLIYPFLVLICVANTVAQDTNSYYPKDYSIIPPSPDVAALLKYTEIPVNYFSGLPEINLPIYEVKEGGLTVPISLSYHGGGIKVDEKAGCVGLGWTLLAGGCISRTVYGHPDDLGSYYTPASGKFNATSNDKTLRTYVMNKSGDYDPLNFEESRLLPIIQNNKNYEEGLSDMANDVFNISALNFSGTFIYDDDRKTILQTSSPIDLFPLMTNGSALPEEYVITDNNGTKYYFGQQEFTTHEYFHGSPYFEPQKENLDYCSSWHLTKIENINKDRITFHYKADGDSINISRGSTTVYTMSHDLMDGYTPKGIESTQWTKYKPQILDYIETSNVIVTFLRDSADKNKITGIKVTRKDENNSIIKEFLFIHDKYNLSDVDMLACVKEKTCNNNYINTYKFGYYDNNSRSGGGPNQDFC